MGLPICLFADDYSDSDFIFDETFVISLLASISVENISILGMKSYSVWIYQEW